MVKEVMLTDIYGEVGDDGKIKSLVVDGQRIPFVGYEMRPVTGGITKIWSGTQAEYDAIATPANDTLYIIVEA